MFKILPFLLYSMRRITPTWPLCNILSIEYERKISNRSCNRWQSSKIAHVCWTIIMFMYSIQVWGLTVPAWPRGYLAMPLIERARVRASTEKFLLIMGILESTLDRVARHGIEFFVYFRKTRELKVDFLHVCVNLIHCFCSALFSLSELFLITCMHFYNTFFCCCFLWS